VLPGKGLPRDDGLRDFYRRLVAIRRAHPALSRGAHQGLATDGDLYVFSMRDPASGDAVVVAVNRGDARASAAFAAPAEWKGAAPSDLLGGAELRCAEARCEVAVGAREAAVVGRAAAR
jgi:alpha-amylase